MIEDIGESCRADVAVSQIFCKTVQKEQKFTYFLHFHAKYGPCPVRLLSGFDVPIHHRSRKEKRMFDTKNDYSLNKNDPNAIVCRSIDGVHIRLTRMDFASNVGPDTGSRIRRAPCHPAGGSQVQPHSKAIPPFEDVLLARLRVRKVLANHVFAIL